jgi:WD40 repeat protein
LRFACFSADGTLLATVAGREAYVWDTSGGDAVCVCKGHEAPIVMVVFSPDGRRLLTDSEDRTAALWDLPSGKLATVYMGHPGPVHLVAFHPGGLFVATASTDPVARIWPVNPVPVVLKRAARTLKSEERKRYDVPSGGE